MAFKVSMQSSTFGVSERGEGGGGVLLKVSMHSSTPDGVMHSQTAS